MNYFGWRNELNTATPLVVEIFTNDEQWLRLTNL